MRILFSLLGLLIVVAVIGFLAKKQLHSVATLPAPAVSASSAGDSASPTGNVREQSQQLQQQVQKQIKDAMEAAAQPRAGAEDK
jgi:hypothetical protein